VGTFPRRAIAVNVSHNLNPRPVIPLVNARQYQIFDLYVLQNWPVAEVARILCVSAEQVYLAKHRISRLLKKEVAKLERGQESGIRV
jgi:RNA polymerase sigma-70 factor (ECF subfamily)